ncbi:hypothetical protein [Nocardia sp. NPDC057030]|uniref:LtfC-like domain-containing protein n=1 Tax=unclassified Nocardia TaxID=2637762 RepID=UPI0036397F25
MTAPPLFDPPQIHSLPVSWHGDCVVDFQQYDPDDAAQIPPVWTPLEYEDGVTAFLDVKTDPPQRFTATITGYHAVVRIESEVADTLRDGWCWVFIKRYPGTPTTEVPIVNGVIARYDGKTS